MTKVWYKVGDEITFECSPGYALVGLKNRVCQSNGKWSESAPECQYVQCENSIILGKISIKNTNLQFNLFLKVMVNISKNQTQVPMDQPKSFHVKKATFLEHRTPKSTLVDCLDGQVRTTISNASASKTTPSKKLSWKPLQNRTVENPEFPSHGF